MQLRDLFDDISGSGSTVRDAELDALLDESLNVTQDWQRAEHLLLSAQARLPDRLEISVALYKMYAYSGRFHEALALIDAVLLQAAGMAGIPSDFRILTPNIGVFENALGPARIYLYTLKARGFVLLRSGSVKLAHEVLLQLERLDPKDQVGGSVVLAMAKSLLEDDLPN